MSADKTEVNLYDIEPVTQAFSVQHHIVAERLEGGQTHRQPWLRSAAYTDTPGDPTGLRHRRAYFWMASQYAKRMGRRLHSAPIWMSFSLKNALAGVKDPDEEVILELRIPASEILTSQYYRSPSHKWERVLYGESCCMHDLGENCYHIDHHAKRQTWDTLFDLTGNSNDWQGTADRLEPQWLVGRSSSAKTDSNS